MFGLEEHKQKKKGNNSSDFEFDLEKEFRDPNKRAEYKQRFEGRVQEIKGILRSGSGSEFFDQYGVLLHGYTSFLKVISRFASSSAS